MPYRGCETFREVLERIANKYPDNPAIFFDGKAMSYRELFEKANR